MIGVFDSGVGGLYTLRELRRLLPSSDFVYFADEANLAEIVSLRSLGVAPSWQEEEKEGVFLGQNVVLTGTLERFKRSEAQKIIEAQGGVCQSSVTQKTTLVIAGAEAGSKLEKARKLGIQVIDEAAFAAMIEK